MKKIIVMMLGLAFAATLNAASVSWSAMSIQVATKGDVLSTYNAYLVDASQDAETVWKAIAAGGGVGTVDGVYATKKVLATGNLAFGNSTVASFTNPNEYNLYALIVNTDKSKYLVTQTLSKLTVSTTGNLLTAGFGDQSSNKNWQPVPEPTSGLLLLLGGALLALRRKQK